MSTMASHFNWGSSYVVNDFFINPDAPEKKLVLVGHVSTVPGGRCRSLASERTGLIFILRWFWWRINAWTEIAGMVVSFLVAFYLEIIRAKIGYEPLPPHLNLIIGVSITTAARLFVTLVIKPADDETLRKFYRLIRPGGAGWNAVLQKAQKAGDPIEQTVLSATFLEEFCV